MRQLVNDQGVYTARELAHLEDYWASYHYYHLRVHEDGTVEGQKGASGEVVTLLSPEDAARHLRAVGLRE